MGRALSLKYTEYGSRRVPGWVPGIALPHPPVIPIPRVHPPTRHVPLTITAAVPGQPKEAVGLKSVDQLTLRSIFSDIRDMTEVYNL